MKYKPRKITKVHPKKAYTGKLYFSSKHIRSIILIILALIIIPTLLFVSTSIHVLFTIHPKSIGMKAVSWNGNSDLNILVGYIDTKNTFTSLSILSLDKQNARLVPLPENIFIQGEGEGLSLQAIYALNVLSGSNTDAMANIQNILEMSLQIPIDGYILIPERVMLPSGTFLQAHFSLPALNVIDVLDHAYEISNFANTKVFTNLSVQTLTTLFVFDRFNLTKISLTSSDMISSSGHQYLISSSVISDISKKLSDSYMLNEHARISVYNGSAVLGEAEKVAGMLNNVGGIIDQIGSFPSSETHSIIYIQSPNQFPGTLARLQLLLHNPIIRHTVYTPTSDITVILGEN